MADQFPRRFGKYTLLEPLAQGGMGALYLGCQGESGMEKMCVVKTVLRDLADKEYQARFRDEAKVVVRLSHGNLVPVFDAGTVEGEMYIAMDYVDGKDLRAVWNRCAAKGIAFPVDVAVYVVKELARGLDHAHRAGALKLVHRDVSPPNVLLAYSGEVKLTDFGLASSTLKLEQTAPGVIYGKVSYMSPEQARGEVLDGRTDIYAAGVILWELLTGRQLFPNGDGDALGRVRNPVLVRPSSRASRVPPALDLIVMKALAPVREERYLDGEALRAALAAWLAREAPTVDASRMAAFLRELFDEEIERELSRRRLLMEEARSLPPTTQASPDRVENPGSTGDPAGASAPVLLGPGAVVDRAGPLSTNGQTEPAPTDAAGHETVEPTDGEADRSAGILGTLVAGRYQILRLLGEGGMGRVYEAEHVEIGKRVAIKVLHPVYTRSADLVARFRREARAASRIGHPNIIDVTDSGTTATGAVFFVMEYLVGSDLSGVIDREHALGVDRAINITIQICHALEAAHEANVIHRDLKPENIFLIARSGETDVVKVLDFGIARHLDVEPGRPRLTRPDMAMGTPEYMAPEQASGKPADARCDVYATGALLYEMLTGAPPHTGAHAMDVLTKKATVTPDPVCEQRDDVPRELSAVIASALSREPSQRPQTMADFARELERARPDRRKLGREAAEPAAQSRTQVTGATTLPLREGRSVVLPVSVAVGATVVLLALGVTAWRETQRGDSKTAPTGGGNVERPAPRTSTHAPAPPPRSAPVTPSPAVAPLILEPTVVSPPKSAGSSAAATTTRNAASTSPGGTAPRGTSGRSSSARAPASTTAARRSLAEGGKLLRDHQLGPAGKIFQRLADANEERAGATVGLSRVAYEGGHYEEAARQAEVAVKLGGGVPAHMALGDANFKLKKFEVAIREFRAVLKIKPDSVDARKHLDAALRASGS